MSDVKWVKLAVDMFDNRKLKYIRKLPDGNNIALIWVMLLTIAGRCNAGGMIFLTENIPYTVKTLADELGFEENTVRLALEAFERLSMITMDRGNFCIAGWDEYQNIDGMERIREQNRVRKQRQRERELLEAPVSDNSRDSHVTVTESHATDIDKDIDIKKKNIIYPCYIADEKKDFSEGFVENSVENPVENPEQRQDDGINWHGLVRTALRFGNEKDARHYAEKAAQSGKPVDIEKLREEIKAR